MEMVKEKEPKTTNPLDDLENLIVRDPENNLLDIAALQAQLAQMQKALDEKTKEVEQLKQTTPPKRKRTVVNSMKKVLELPLRKRYGVLISLLQKLPYELPTNEELDLDALVERPIDQKFIADIALLLAEENSGFRKRAPSKEPDYFRTYFERLGIAVAPKIKVEVEEECPL